MTRCAPPMNRQKIDVYLRHVHEGGAKVAAFLNAHPEIDPDLIEDMTETQEAELKRFTSDLRVTQQIERGELDREP
jgi:hypothetical protein